MIRQMRSREAWVQCSTGCGKGSCPLGRRFHGRSMTGLTGAVPWPSGGLVHARGKQVENHIVIVEPRRNQSVVRKRQARASPTPIGAHQLGTTAHQPTSRGAVCVITNAAVSLWVPTWMGTDHGRDKPAAGSDALIRSFRSRGASDRKGGLPLGMHPVAIYHVRCNQAQNEKRARRSFGGPPHEDVGYGYPVQP